MEAFHLPGHLRHNVDELTGRNTQAAKEHIPGLSNRQIPPSGNATINIPSQNRTQVLSVDWGINDETMDERPPQDMQPSTEHRRAPTILPRTVSDVCQDASSNLRPSFLASPTIAIPSTTVSDNLILDGKKKLADVANDNTEGSSYSPTPSQLATSAATPSTTSSNTTITTTTRKQLIITCSNNIKGRVEVSATTTMNEVRNLIVNEFDDDMLPVFVLVLMLVLALLWDPEVLEKLCVRLSVLNTLLKVSLRSFVPSFKAFGT